MSPSLVGYECSPHGLLCYLPGTCTASLHNPLPSIGSATVGACWRGLALGLFSTAIDGKERADSAEEEVATGD